jgi:hypothetical protein
MIWIASYSTIHTLSIRKLSDYESDALPPRASLPDLKKVSPLVQSCAQINGNRHDMTQNWKLYIHVLMYL